MIEESRITWTRRISRAVYALVLNFVLWILLPTYLAGFVKSTGASTPLTDPFILAFGATITGLQVLAALTEGTAPSAISSSGSFIAEAYYIWAASDAGAIALTVGQTRVALSFQPLLFLFVLPSLFSALRVPLVYMLDSSEAVSPSKDTG